MRYILNSAVITSPGLYRYRLGQVSEAREFLLNAPICAVGYEETAQALSRITGIPVSVNRQQIAMCPGDQALVFRLVFPPGAPRLSSMDKGFVSLKYILQHCEIGFLEWLK